MARLAGLGCDILETQRIKSLLDAGGERFCQRVLGSAELQEYANRSARNESRGLMFLASRYCAKEAFAKAMGTGVGKAFSFQDLQIMNDEAGKPVLQYSEKLGSWMRTNRFTALLSLSDETHYVMATVIFEQQDY